MNQWLDRFRKNRTLYMTLGVMLILFLMAIGGMTTEEWTVTLLRSLSVGALTFLVASGFSIIFGLMDVLNLAHGTLFMVGAYIGWTVFVRPDTFVDLLTPAALILAGIVLRPLWQQLLGKVPGLGSRPSDPKTGWLAKLAPWVILGLGAVLIYFNLRNYPITLWDVSLFAESPGTYAFNATQGNYIIPTPKLFTTNPYLVLVGLILGSVVFGLGLAAFSLGQPGTSADNGTSLRTPLAAGSGLLALGLASFFFHGGLTDWLVGLDRTALFFLAVLTAFLSGFGLGMLIETALIRPLYARPVYQILMTLGISLVGIEIVRAIWGRPEFTMPKPDLFTTTGEICATTNVFTALANRCSTFLMFGGRVRTYNEIFIPFVGLAVLIAVWLLLQRTRLGMIIRAGVQDSQMVEALGINVRQVFTLVFGLGVGLAALGGVFAGPSIGLSNTMGEVFLINALIALAIGGLTSFPGAAVGSILVGLIQQFIIKYGQIGINLPFLDEPFKPTPPLVPASTVLLMVFILLVMPNGLLGRKE